jgi:putative redox protein
VKAIVESAGKVASKVRLGSHEVLFDQPATVPGGEDRGPSPLDVLVVAVAACAHYYAAAYLHGRGLSTLGLSVAVDADKERVPSPRIGRLVMKVQVPPGLPEDRLIGMVRAIKRCPAYGTLLRPPTVEIFVNTSQVTSAGDLKVAG